MDYHKKYIKYKTKYLQLKMKNNMHGGNYPLSFVTRLNELYSLFLKKFNENYIVKPIRCETMEDGPQCFSFSEDEINYDKSFNINNLQIENTMNDINIKFIKYKIIELRPYKGEKELVLSCGNFRLDDSGGHPFERYDEKYENTDRPSKNIYYSNHNHYGCYTIDMNLATNASTVGIFGKQNFPNLPNNSFKIIYNEGGNVGMIESNQLLNTEILRLLEPDGFFITYGEGNALYYQKKDKLIESNEINFNDYKKVNNIRTIIT
jgi:hypothetical protein